VGGGVKDYQVRNDHRGDPDRSKANHPPVVHSHLRPQERDGERWGEVPTFPYLPLLQATK